MKIKTSELIGAALDWAVAKCEKVVLEYGLTEDERYSTEWSQSGPIIERERIDLGWEAYDTEETDGTWVATIYRISGHKQHDGPTPLIAAMRCFVASKLGDEVEIPDELE